MPKTTKQRAMIAEAAYFKSERRGFAPGYEVADWLEAEREVEAILTGKRPSPAKKSRNNATPSATGKR
jgi:hypothetical protein